MLIKEKTILIVLLMVIWVLPWKGYALWVSAQKRDKPWFIFLLFPINTLALLDIFYIFWVAKKKPSDIKEVLVRMYRKGKRMVSFRK